MDNHIARSGFSLMLLVIFAACTQAGSGNGPDELSLRITPERIAAGGEVTLVLHNGSAETVGYNLCTSALMRQVDNAWEPVPEDRVCTMELRSLDPGREDRFTLQLPADLPAGQYRYETTIDDLEDGTREPVATPPFTVAG